MAIQIVGFQEVAPHAMTLGGTTAAFALTGGLAAQPSPGDLVVVFGGAASNNDRQPTVATEGYSAPLRLYANDSNDAQGALQHKVMGPSPDAGVTIGYNIGLSNHYGAALIVVLRSSIGAALTVRSIRTETGNNTCVTRPPGMGMLHEGTALLYCGVGAYSASAGEIPFAVPTDLDHWRQVTGPAAAAVGFQMGLGLKTSLPHGGFMPAAWTSARGTNGSDSWAGYSMAVHEAGAAPIEYGTVAAIGAKELHGICQGSYPLDLAAGWSHGGAPEAGDVIALVGTIGANTGRYIEVRSGLWTLLAGSTLFGNDAWDTTQRVYWKAMGAVPDPEVLIEFTSSAAGSSFSVTALLLRGADPANAINAVESSTGGNSGAAQPPPIRPFIPGALAVVVGSHGFTASLSTGGLATTGLAVASDYVNTQASYAHAGLVGTVPYDGVNTIVPAAMTMEGADSADFAWAAQAFAVAPKRLVAAAPAEVSGSGAGGLAPQGTGAGLVDVQGSGAGGLAASGAGAASVAVAGQGSGSLAASGSATGEASDPALTGSGAGGPDLGGSGAAAVGVEGLGNGGLAPEGAASGETDALATSGTGSGGLAPGGTGGGAVGVAGSGAGGLDPGGASQGDVGIQGQAAGGPAPGGSGAGAVLVDGGGSGGLAPGGAAAGLAEAPSRGREVQGLWRERMRPAAWTMRAGRGVWRERQAQGVFR